MMSPAANPNQASGYCGRRSRFGGRENLELLLPSLWALLNAWSAG
jgi:hypothetical protein